MRGGAGRAAAPRVRRELQSSISGRWILSTFLPARSYSRVMGTPRLSTRADRPYGRFPSGGAKDESPAEPEPRALTPRERILGTGRIRRIRVTLASLAILLLIAGVIGGGRPSSRAGVPPPSPQPTPTVPEIYGILAPSVVGIRAWTSASKEPSSGSGVIADETASILTAWHVVRDAQRIVVSFADGSEGEARIVASLPERDIAVIRPFAPPAVVVPAVLGDPGRLRTGDEIFVIGDPLGLTRSYSAGIVSGLERTVRFAELPQPISGLIQFDAAVNPGSSGGPLIDHRGEVVGIVTGVVNPNDERSFAGIGFAVTIDSAASALGIPPD